MIILLEVSTWATLLLGINLACNNLILTKLSDIANN